ncbi:MAG: translocation protein TolB, partial [Terriglobales bacterium]
MSRHDKQSPLGRQSFLLVVALCFALAATSSAQDWIRTGTGLGVEKVRLATTDFKPSTQDAKNTELLKTFNSTLWNDLDNAGIFVLVSKSFYPVQTPGQPAEVKFADWSAPPPEASMLAFGNLGVAADKVAVQGWLYDVKNQSSPQVLGKQYSDAATADAVRLIAHKFADEIIFRLGGGIQGIAETKIFFVSDRTGHKEIWMMDYDGANQQQITHLGSISLSPRISPDGSRLAFSSATKGGWETLMYSFDLNRMVAFARFGGMNFSPAWSPDGKIAFSSSRNGYPNIFVVDGSGGHLQRLTNDKGPEV